jgi:hypothetical protein
MYSARWSFRYCGSAQINTNESIYSVGNEALSPVEFTEQCSKNMALCTVVLGEHTFCLQLRLAKQYLKMIYVLQGNDIYHKLRNTECGNRSGSYFPNEYISYLRESVIKIQVRQIFIGLPHRPRRRKLVAFEYKFIIIFAIHSFHRNMHIACFNVICIIIKDSNNFQNFNF